MILTAAQAKELTCPLSMANTPTKCLAEGCMAWRSGHDPLPELTEENSAEEKEVGDLIAGAGRCGICDGPLPTIQVKS
jgi:hypothetical protein